MQSGAGTRGEEAEDAFDCLTEGARLESRVIMRLEAPVLERASPRAGELKGRAWSAGCHGGAGKSANIQPQTCQKHEVQTIK